MPFCRRGGVTLHYRSTPGADTDAPTLVFANSLGTDLRLWDGVLDRLGRRWPTLTHDKRGHGLSDAPAGAYALDDHVADLEAILDHAGVSQAVIVGLSVGGMIAIRAAARSPERVRALFLCDTGHEIGDARLWDERIAAVTERGMVGMADAILERWFTPGFRASGDPALAGCRNMLLAQPAQGYAGTCAAIRDAHLAGVARSLRLPVRGLVGADDPATPPALMEATIALIPGAGLDVVPSCGHIPPIEQPDALVAHLVAFLEEIGT